MFLLGMLFIISMQPVFMITILIMMTFMYSMKMYENMGGYWFSYMLLMVMLSGVLVVFTYMVSLIPNESFEIYGMIILFFMMISILIEFFCKYKYDMSMMSINFWNSYMGFMNLFMIVFLLMIMLLVVIISYNKSYFINL